MKGIAGGCGCIIFAYSIEHNNPLLNYHFIFNICAFLSFIVGFVLLVIPFKIVSSPSHSNRRSQPREINFEGPYHRQHDEPNNTIYDNSDKKSKSVILDQSTPSIRSSEVDKFDKD
jgi:hypothetical protein